jgi:hypothetical protein
MYAKVINETVEKYPYSLGQLQKDYPNVSFPKNPNKETFAEWGVVFVEATPQPSFDQVNQNCNEINPVKENGVWVQTWLVTDATQEQIADRTDSKSTAIRYQRNELLAETDWRFRSDMNPSQAWIDYCQALRDITGQEGFPWAVQWPTKPE